MNIYKNSYKNILQIIQRDLDSNRTMEKDNLKLKYKMILRMKRDFWINKRNGN